MRVETITASAPPMDASVDAAQPQLYPDLSAQGHGFRLQKICELQKQLEGERDTRAALYKKYRRGINLVDGFDTALAIASLVTGAGGIVLLATIIATPVVVILEACALAFGLASVVCKFVSRKLATKAKKHDEIRVLAESKLNTIADIISRSLMDNNINDKEFRMVLDEVDKYSDMKKEMRLKAHHAHAAVTLDEEEKKRLIAQGREAAQADLLKAMGGNLP